MRSELSSIDTHIKNMISGVLQAIEEKSKERLIYKLSIIITYHTNEILKATTDIEIEDKSEIIRKLLSDNVFICNRVWEAWQVGTMTAEDFEPASDNETLISELSDICDS